MLFDNLVKTFSVLLCYVQTPSTSHTSYSPSSPSCHLSFKTENAIWQCWHSAVSQCGVVGFNNKISKRDKIKFVNRKTKIIYYPEENWFVFLFYFTIEHESLSLIPPIQILWTEALFSFHPDQLQFVLIKFSVIDNIKPLDTEQRCHGPDYTDEDVMQNINYHTKGEAHIS